MRFVTVVADCICTSNVVVIYVVIITIVVAY